MLALQVGNIFGDRTEGLRSGKSRGSTRLDKPTFDFRPVAIVLLLAAIILFVRAWVGRSGMPFFADTDDAMRMVMVREFLAGQNWFDLTAHRLNTPSGAELHWSRLIDLPLAALLLIFTPILGNDAALLAAGSVWPMVLLGVLLWLSARLAFRLVGPEGVLPALILPVLSPAITAEFTPGRVDHHNVIVVLTLAIVWASVEAIRNPRFAVVAGLLTATALAIATESLPALAAATTAFGLGFVFDASRRTAMRNFGLAFGLGSVVHLAIFRLPARWLEPACDVLSPVYCAFALLVALVFTLPAILPPIRAQWQRFAILTLPGGAGLLALGLAYPQCLSGPYAALDPWLQANWIAGIIEAKPWLSNLQEMPAYALGVGVPILLAILAVFGRLRWVRKGRAEWAVLLVFLAMTTLVMLAQVRGARLAIMPAIPAAAWLIVTFRQRYLAKASLGNVAALLGSWLAFSGVVLALTVNGILAITPSKAQQVEVSSRSDPEKCLLHSAFTSLTELPPKRIMAPIDLGAHIMLYTPHEVVAAPYHRNQEGVRDAFRFLNEPIDYARSLLAERGIGLVVICPGMPELAGLPSQAPDSFVNLFWQDNLPDWLENMSEPAGPLRIWAVVP